MFIRLPFYIGLKTATAKATKRDMNNSAVMFLDTQQAISENPDQANATANAVGHRPFTSPYDSNVTTQSTAKQLSRRRAIDEQTLTMS